MIDFVDRDDRLDFVERAMKTVPPPTPSEIAAMEKERWAKIAKRRAHKDYVNDWTEVGHAH